MDNYTIYCTEEQTKKAIEIGAPISRHWDFYSEKPIDNECYLGDHEFAKFPTSEQMIGWLEEQKLSLTIYNNLNITFAFELNSMSNGRRYSTRKGATLAAIDAALEYLSINKKNN